MIDLHYWPTPNGWKITIALEEMEIPYRVVPVILGRGAQFEPEFLRISPNGRMPAIVDDEPLGGGEPLSIFESGAILLYLGEKSGRFLPADVRGRYDVVQWVMWQMGGLGPMMSQSYHFRRYAPEPIPYAIDRYGREVERLFAVLERRLADREWLAGEYSVADMASWPWVIGYKRHDIDLAAAYPHVKRWHEQMKARPAARRGIDVGKEWRDLAPDDEARRILFGQGRTSAAEDT